MVSLTLLEGLRSSADVLSTTNFEDETAVIYVSPDGGSSGSGCGSQGNFNNYWCRLMYPACFLIDVFPTQYQNNLASLVNPV